MAEAEASGESEQEEEAPKKKGKGMLIGLVLALVLGGGGFYAVFSGMILAPADPHAEATSPEEEEALPLPDVVFVPIQPLLINIGGTSSEQFLRFQAQLEVRTSAEQEVIDVLPRVVDVLNGYLRAVDVSELRERSALVRLRAQMLRRVQVVTGEGRVRDLLIMEFVLS